MNLVVKGRHDRISPRTRQRLERKLARLERIEPRMDLVEIEVTREASKRVAGGHRVQVAFRAARRTYRATGTGTDVDAALEQVVHRLERLVSEGHDRRRARPSRSDAARRRAPSDGEGT